MYNFNSLLVISNSTVKRFMSGLFTWNFWEKPMVHYRSLNACNNAGKMLSIQIRSNLEQKGLTITEGELWCIETTKQQGS
jgi:hypothetical protein